MLYSFLQGGGPAGNGGLAPRIEGEFTLEANTKLSIVVGQKGIQRVNGAFCASGGGGTFIVDESNPLIIAGSGGGLYSGLPACPGLTGMAGGNTSKFYISHAIDRYCKLLHLVIARFSFPKALKFD